MKSLVKIFGIIMMMVIGLLVSCDTGGGGGGGEGGGDPLILPSGYAWTNYFINGDEESDGYIFTSGGTVYAIQNYIEPWKIQNFFPYTKAGNEIEFAGETYSYSVDGDTLEFDGMNYKKTQVGGITEIIEILEEDTVGNVTVPAELQGTWIDNNDESPLGYIFMKTTFIITQQGDGDLYVKDLNFTTSSYDGLFARDLAYLDEQLNKGEITQTEYEEKLTEGENLYEELSLLYPSLYLVNGTLILNGEDLAESLGSELYGGWPLFFSPERDETLGGEFILTKQ